MQPRKDRAEETTEFLGYLRDHPGSTTLAESIAELVASRRAAAARRAQAKLRMIPIELNADLRSRVAS